MTDEEYVLDRVDKEESGCWSWLGYRNSDGYGYYIRGSDPNRRQGQAHRLAYQVFRGPIPEGTEIHHTCTNRACVNPAHLKPVSHAANMEATRGRTHCKHGHAYTPENTYVHPSGRYRYCRACKNERRLIGPTHRRYVAVSE